MPNKAFNSGSLQRGMCFANFTPRYKSLRRQAGSVLPVNLALGIQALETSELIMLSALGTPAGAFLLALFSGPERVSLRRAVAKWCLIFGGVSTALAIISVATHFDPVPTRGVLGMAFIGLPALPAGLLLYFFSRRAPSEKKASHNGHA